MNSSSEYKEDVVPSRDPGGGGDMTFHQMKEVYPAESHQDDLNTNTELLDNKGIPGGKCDEHKTKADAKNIGKRLQHVDDDNCDVEVSPFEVPEKRQGGDGEEESKEDGGGKTSLPDENNIQGQQQEDQETFDTRDPRIFSRQQRSNVYNKACILQQEGNINEALKYFVATITGLTENNTFHELPQCLHHVSNIYFEKNEYEKAVHFIQAEKMYYETALLDIVNLQKQLGEKRKQKQVDKEVSSETRTKDADQTSKDENISEATVTHPEITKAREFEHLARLCLSEKKPQLALEYCGRATKIYRLQLGDDHPITVDSLDLFALVYAEVGKKLYEDAMKKFGVDEGEKEKADDEMKVTSQQESSIAQDDSSANTTGVRQRNKPGKETLVKPDQRNSEPKMHLEEHEPTKPISEQDDWVNTVLLMILFVLVTFLFALIFSFLYCRNNERSEMCAEFKGDLSYWYLQIQHTIKYYTSSGRR